MDTPNLDQRQDDQPSAIVGGPGQDEPQVETSPDAPQPKKIKIGAREFEVSPEMAEAYEAREREYARGISEQGRELGQLRQRVQQLEPRQDPQKPQGVNYNELIWDNPKEALEHHGKEVEERVYNRVRSEYDQQQKWNAFWDHFYDANTDLERKKDDKLVQYVLQSNYEVLGPLPPTEAAKELARMTRETMLLFGSRVKGDTQPLPQGKARAEGPSNARGSTPTSTQTTQPGSLSDAIRARRQARRGR